MAITINADNGIVSGTSGLKYLPDNSGVIQFQTSGVSTMTIDTSRNVVMANSANVTGVLNTGNTTVTGTLVSNAHSMTGNLTVTGSTVLTGAAFVNGAVTFANSTSNVVSVTSTGLGINTANTTSPLTIGRVAANSSEGGQIDLCRAIDNVNSWGIDVYGSGNNTILRVLDNINSSVYMAVTTSGNVGFSTTTPAARVHVVGTFLASGYSLVGNGNDSSRVATSIIIAYNDVANGDGNNLVVTDSGTITTNALKRPSSAPGATMFYGPYWDIPPGNYVAKFRMKVANNSSSSNILYIDAVGTNITTNPAGSQNRQLQPNSFSASNVWQYFNLYFTKTSAGGYIEVRGLSFGSGITDIFLDHILIQPS